jgi:MFS transporter, ACS family, D-galactonate transporter
MQIPAGWLVDRFDVKWVFTAGFFLWSAATATTAVIHGFAALIVIRVILGVGESVAFPSYCKILSTHFTESRRGFANSAIMAGLGLGPAIGILVGGSVVARFGWRPFFLALGAGGLFWLIPWLAWMPSRTRAATPASETAAGILDILRHRAAWGSCLGQFCINYTLYFLVTWLPSYLIRARHLSMNQMAQVGGLVFFLSSVAGIGLGKLSDQWIAAGSSPTLVRKTMLGIGQAGLGASLAASAFAPQSIFVWILAPAGIFLGMSGGNCWAVTQTIAGTKVAGRWAGVQNFIGNLAGSVAPILTGYLLGRTGQFYWPMVIAGVVSWIGALSWVFAIGPVEPADWERELRRPSFPVGASAATGTARP